MSEIKQVTKDTFNREVLQSDLKVLLDFWVPWCKPCERLSSVMDDLARERKDIKICKINTEEEPELAQQCRIIVVPTLYVIENGQRTASMAGMHTKQEIIKMLEE